MSNKKAVIKIEADVKEAKQGIDAVSQKLNQLAKSVQKSRFEKLAGSITLAGRAFSTVKSAINTVTNAIDDMTAAYNTQAQAEKQLEAAARNNPYLSDYSVQQLKDYAGQLQSISTVGDEELLPMMAQLAAAGRTQAEIQDILSASLDMSASGAMSLETAVKQLNATYSGSAGRLGQMSGAIKGLTADQLRNGEAVRIMKEQYSGIAKAVSDTTGGWQKFKNSFGDFKETLGKGFASIQNTTGKILSNFFDTITSKIKSAGEEADTFKKKLGIIATLDDKNADVSDLEGLIKQIEDEIKRLDNIKAFSSLKNGLDDYKQAAKDARKEAEDFRRSEEKKWDENYNLARGRVTEYWRNARLAEQQGNENGKNYWTTQALRAEDAVKKTEDERNKAINASKVKVEALKEEEKQAKKTGMALEWAWVVEYAGNETKLLEDRSKLTEQLALAQTRLAKAKKEAGAVEQTEADQKALDIITKNTAELNKNIDSIERKYALMEQEGKKVDGVAKAQEILAAKESAYLALISEDTSFVTQNNSVAKARLADIRQGYEEVTEALKKKAAAEKDTEALKELKEEAEKLTQETKKFIGAFDEDKLSTRIEKTIANLEAMKETLAGNTEEAEELQKKIDALAGLLDDVQKEENEAGNGDQSEIEKWAQTYEQKLQIVSDFAGKYADIMKGISDLATESAKNEASVKQAELEKQLAAGLISQEEYAEKKEQIDRESAEKQYRMQMWAWAANLVNIQAQTALAIVSTLAQETGPAALKIAMSSLIGAMGAIQLATAISNKPVPPSFATGGVVGGFQGASLGGDNTYIHARQGEMILNAAQQKAMWDTLNGAGHGGMQMNVTVRNTASNIVTATPQLTRQGLEVYIKQTVRRQMEDGEYDSAMLAASLNETGIRYTN